MLGVSLPVQGTVQQVIVTEAAAPAMRHLVAHASRHLSLKQGDGGHVLVGGGWPGMVDARHFPRNLRRSMEGNLWIAGRVLPALAGLHAIRAWTGINVHIDRAPILGETPGLPGFFHAVTSNGYTLGPVAGRMTADAVLGRRSRCRPHFPWRGSGKRLKRTENEGGLGEAPSPSLPAMKDGNDATRHGRPWPHGRQYRAAAVARRPPGCRL